jgi:hypothetical protein
MAHLNNLNLTTLSSKRIYFVKTLTKLSTSFIFWENMGKFYHFLISFIFQ